MDVNLKKLIKELEERHTGLEVRTNREELDKILADDFFEIGSSGYMFDEKECLESGVVLTEMSLHNHKIYPLSSYVVLSTYFVVDKTRNRNTLRSSISGAYVPDPLQTRQLFLFYYRGRLTKPKKDDPCSIQKSSFRSSIGFF
jgi:hypothetical protein